MKTDKDIIRLLREKAAEHRGLADELDKAANKYASVLGADDLDNQINNKQDSETISELSGAKKQMKSSTFKEVIKDILRDGIPRTAKQLYNIYNKQTDKNVKYNSFSGQLSQLNKQGNVIKMLKILENPVESRFIYGLFSWFENDKLKREYINKIKL